MRTNGFMASVIAGCLCVAYAAGHLPENIFGDTLKWIWWLFAAWWFSVAIRFVFQREIG